MKLQYSPKSTNVIDLRGQVFTEQTVVNLSKKNKRKIEQRVTSAKKGDKK